MARLPMLNTPRFIEEHDARNRRIYAYIHTQRGRRRVSPEIREEMTFRSACSAKANNHFARIAFAHAADGEFRKLARRRRLKNFSFVTLAPMHFRRPLAHAGKVDLFQFRTWIRDRFGAFDYLGMIEVGFYTTGLAGERGQKVVSWHAHLVIWNCPVADVEAIVNGINGGNADDLPPAHHRLLGIDGAASRMVYVMKAPMDEHRISVSPTLEGVSRRRQYSRAIRTGDAIDLLPLFLRKTIPELFVSAGQGTRLGKRIIVRAKRTLEADEDRHVANLERLLGHSHRRFRQS